MKTIALVSVLFMSLTAFAGPEERKETQTCYRLNSIVEGVEVPANLPPEVCIEELVIDPVSQKVTAYSYFQAELYQDIRIRSFTREATGGYSFEVSSEFYEHREEGTYDALRLAIFGQTDANGLADLKNLKVAVVRETETDFGHSGTDYETFEYSLK